jgi:hypothetical protein
MAECSPGLLFGAAADLAEGPAVRLQENNANEIQTTALLRTFINCSFLAGLPIQNLALPDLCVPAH